MTTSFPNRGSFVLCNRAHRAVRNWRVDRVAMLFLVESELLDPVAQRAERHAEQFRGAGFVVARLLQRFADRVPLYFFHLRTECGSALRLRQSRRWPQLQVRSEEHTSELQSLMRISYAVFCLKK